MQKKYNKPKLYKFEKFNEKKNTKTFKQRKQKNIN